MDKIAFFDIDDTLIDGQTQKLLVTWAFKKGRINLFRLFDLLLFFAKYKLGLVDNVAGMMSKSYSLVAGWSVEETEALIREAFQKKMKDEIFTKGRELIEKLKMEGCRIILVSNTLQQIVDLLSHELAVEKSLGTVLSREGEKFSGKIGRLMYGKEKVRYIKEFLGADFDFSACSAYSDNKSDLPLLELVGKPFAVNPDAVLRQIALSRQWPIIEFKS